MPVPADGFAEPVLQQGGNRTLASGCSEVTATHAKMPGNQLEVTYLQTVRGVQQREGVWTHNVIQPRLKTAATGRYRIEHAGDIVCKRYGATAGDTNRCHTGPRAVISVQSVLQR